MVQIRKSEDRLIHFIWKDRNSNKIEDDLIIFPDDIEFSRVSKCTTGRVYVLKFKSSPRRMFFWMQEPSDKKDKYFCNKVNQYLNKLPVSECFFWMQEPSDKKDKYFCNKVNQYL